MFDYNIRQKLYLQLHHFSFIMAVEPCDDSQTLRLMGPVSFLDHKVDATISPLISPLDR